MKSWQTYSNHSTHVHNIFKICMHLNISSTHMCETALVYEHCDVKQHSPSHPTVRPMMQSPWICPDYFCSESLHLLFLSLEFFPWDFCKTGSSCSELSSDVFYTKNPCYNHSVLSTTCTSLPHCTLFHYLPYFSLALIIVDRYCIIYWLYSFARWFPMRAETLPDLFLQYP